MYKLYKTYIKYFARLFLASVCLLETVVCSDQKAADEVSVTRVNAVKANRDPRDYQKWCDRVFSPTDAPKVVLPALEGAGNPGAVTSLPARRWVWINLWATWCKPCIREMPMLQLWQTQLSKFGQSFDLWFVSVDQDKEELERFLKEHPDLASSNTLRLTNPESMEEWLKNYGVSAMASVPIHLIADPAGAVRCVRTGSLSDGDFSIVKNLIR